MNFIVLGLQRRHRQTMDLFNDKAHPSINPAFLYRTTQDHTYRPIPSLKKPQ